ncbi:hypothetical protein SBA5_560011 [Candidatus Sulfotelmatomonas gaucii]|uniref:Uncharacterized protein n=1 Tax=Candidatus Sulfuritelmatomonas gaucii TaxID=2043161 RepID=A0A2N9LUM8_9BACT|nr:hypothetical protein SBA5_560011 [Candidatus Sulfotelmatomonas gaucii]
MRVTARGVESMRFQNELGVVPISKQIAPSGSCRLFIVQTASYPLQASHKWFANLRLAKGRFFALSPTVTGQVRSAEGEDHDG